MLSSENECFIRFILLLIRGGTVVVRQIVQWGLDRQHSTVTDFLQNNREAIKNSTQLTRQQKNFLHPKVRQAADLLQWDISLLVAFAINFLKPVLNTTEVKILEKIRAFRNTYQGHPKDARMDLNTFSQVWTKLTLMITTIAHNMDEPEQNMLLTLVETSANENLELSAAIEELRFHSRMDVMTDTLLKRMETLKDSITSCHQDVHEVLKTNAGLKAQLEEVIAELKQEKVIQTIYGEFRITAKTKHVIAKVEERLLEACQPSNGNSELVESAVVAKMETFIKTVEDMGVKVEKIEKGSIIFAFECSTLSAINELMKYFQSKELRALLDELEKLLENETQAAVSIEAFIHPEPVQKILEKYKPTGTLRFTMTCTGVEGLQHAFNVFEDEGASNSLNSLSEAISEEFGEQVTIQTNLDKKQMQQAIDSTKQVLGGTTPSVETSVSSDEICSQKLCTACPRNSRQREAEQYCAACELFLCGPCTENHAQFPPLKSHVLLPKSAFDVASLDMGYAETLTEECSEHPGNLIQMFCAEHDFIGCGVCVTVSHRGCNVEHITDVARTVLKSHDRYHANNTLSNVGLDLEDVKSTLIRERSRLTDTHYKVLTDLQTQKTRISERLHDLDRASTEALSTKYKKVFEDINENIAKIDQMQQKLEEKRTTIANVRDENKGQLFVGLKQAKQLSQEAKNAQKQVSEDSESRRFVYHLNYDLEEAINSVSTLVEFQKEVEEKAQLVGEYEVRIQSDICNVTSCCVLDNTGIAITDANNNRLKILDKSFRVVDWCHIPGEPSGVCQTSSDLLAASLYRAKKVQFVTYSSHLSIEKSFEVGDGCLRISHNSGKLNIICADVKFVGAVCYTLKGTSHIRIFNLEGVMLRKLYVDETGLQLFSNPCNLTADRDFIFVADFDNGVVVINNEGNRKIIVVENKGNPICGTFGICEGEENQLYICGRISNNVALFSKEGVFLREAVRSTDGIEKPVALAYLKESKQLVVSCENSETLKVFQMPK